MQMQKIIDGLIKYGGGAIAAIIAWRLIKGGVLGAGKSAAYLSAKDSPEGLQAIRLDQAMNPSGWEISREVDGTDEEEVLATAATITNLNKVADWYNSIAPGRNLIEDLQKELNSEDFQKFMALVKSGNSGATSKMQASNRSAGVSKAKQIVSTARKSGGGIKSDFKKAIGQPLETAVENAYLFKTPNPRSCILFTVPRKGEMIGIVIQRRTYNNTENYYRISVNGKLAWVSEKAIK